jgi:hypothetical protein
VNAAELGKALLARVRASTPPHDDTLAAQLRFAHDHLRGNQGRGLMTVGQFAAPLVMVPAYYFSLPLFVCLVGASVVGAGRVFVRSRRRDEEVRELVTAEAERDVHHAEELVTGCFAEAIVGDVEAVEIEEREAE